MELWRDPAFRHGVALFNERRYFDAHEALEDVWRPARGDERRFLQGLVQVAVALHHASTSNRVGATSVLARALGNLASYPAEYGGVQLQSLRKTLGRWHEALAAGRDLPAPPRIRLRRKRADAPAERC